MGMVMVLNTIGLPSGDIALILSVDWLLDRFRTTINVLGDAIGAGIVHHLSKKELDRLKSIDELEVNNADGIGSNSADKRTKSEAALAQQNKAFEMEALDKN